MAHVVFIAFVPLLISITPQLQAQAPLVTLVDSDFAAWESEMFLGRVGESFQVDRGFLLAERDDPWDNMVLDWVGDRLIGVYETEDPPGSATTKLLEIDLVRKTSTEIGRISAWPVDSVSGDEQGRLWVASSSRVSAYDMDTGELMSEFEIDQPGPISHYRGEMYSMCYFEFEPWFCVVDTTTGELSHLTPAPFQDPEADHLPRPLEMDFDSEGGLWVVVLYLKGDWFGIEAWRRLHYTPDPWAGLDWQHGGKEEHSRGITAGVFRVEDIPATGQLGQILLTVALAALALAFLKLR